MAKLMAKPADYISNVDPREEWPANYLEGGLQLCTMFDPVQLGVVKDPKKVAVVSAVGRSIVDWDELASKTQAVYGWNWISGTSELQWYARAEAEPDYIVIADSAVNCYNHLQRWRQDGAIYSSAPGDRGTVDPVVFPVLVVHPCVNPGSYRTWPGPVQYYLVTDQNLGLFTVGLPDLFPRAPVIQGAGNVTNCQIALAMMMGYKRIVLAGSDFCTVDGWQRWDIEGERETYVVDYTGGVTDLQNIAYRQALVEMVMRHPHIRSGDVQIVSTGRGMLRGDTPMFGELEDWIPYVSPEEIVERWSR